jgi:glycosyltransferase involved in cell wall biosynthesis
MNMRIAINVSGIVENTGLHYYGEKLLKYFNRLSPHNVYIYLNHSITKNHRNLAEKIENNLWEQIVQPITLLSKNVDILHSIKNSGLPLIHVCKYVLTICDTIPLIYPHEYMKSKIKEFIYLTRLKNSIKVADKLIFLNRYVLKDIINFVYIPEEKVCVIPLGVDEEDLQAISKERVLYVRNKFNIGRFHYIFAVGSNEPRKNNISLIKAFVKLKTEKKLNNFKLVIASRRWYNPEFDIYIYRLNETIKRDIIFTGNINREELFVLYKEANMFVFLSLYEGFGIPLLEAMLYRVPVITSNIPVISEIVGDAAIKVDPLNIRSIANAIEGLVSNKQLRCSLIEKGNKRVQLFPFRKTAELTLQLYDKLLLGSQEIG